MRDLRKNLEIPFIPELDELSQEDITEVLYDRGARHTIDKVNWPQDYPYKPITYFIVGRGCHKLYVQFVVRSNYLRAVNSQDQSPVEEDSCVGFAFRNSRTGQIYDFAFNCIGYCKVMKGPDTESMKFVDQESLMSIVRLTDLDKRPFVEIEGLFGWHVMVGVPLEMIDMAHDDLYDLSGNFYKRADKTSLPHFVSWNPVGTENKDLLNPEYFAKIEFKQK